MKERLHDDYPFLNCTFCNKEMETLEHLTKCEVIEREWNEISDIAITESIIDGGVDKSDSKVLDDQFANFKYTFVNYSNGRAVNASPSRLEWLKGHMPKYIKKKLQKFGKNSAQSKTISTSVTHHLQKLFREKIWKKRCEINKMKEEQSGVYVQRIIKRNKERRSNPTRAKRHTNDTHKETQTVRCDIRGRRILNPEDKTEWAKESATKNWSEKIKNGLVQSFKYFKNRLVSIGNNNKIHPEKTTRAQEMPRSTEMEHR
jgi:hypothetical protein